MSKRANDLDKNQGSQVEGTYKNMEWGRQKRRSSGICSINTSSQFLKHVCVRRIYAHTVEMYMYVYLHVHLHAYYAYALYFS